MRTAIALCVLLVAPVFAQSPVSVANGTFTNTSKKAIVLIVGDLNFGSTVMPFVHESLFKQNLTNPGDSENFADTDKLTITFVQFADGTTWGSPSGPSAQWALTRRKAALSYLPTLANTGTESGFVSALNQPQTDKNVIKEQRRYQADLASGGASVAWANVRARWAQAQGRSSLWNF